MLSPWKTISLDEFAELARGQHLPGCAPTEEYVKQVTTLSREFGFEIQMAKGVRANGSVYMSFRRKPDWSREVGPGDPGISL